MSALNGDSAGQEWSGRELHGTGFDDDFGVAEPTLLAALADRANETAWMAALAGARLIVPIVAAPTDIDNSGDLAVEKSTDMAVVTLTAPDGQRALPVFTGLTALQQWDPHARPSPVRAAVAAQAAVSEQCEVMVVDVSSPGTVALRPSMVWALAQQREWLPAHQDPFVRDAVTAAASDEPDVQSVLCEAGGADALGALRVVLSLRPGLEPDQVQALAQRVGERIATDGEARARIDALAFAIRAA
ncbi:SseB family protein [Leekyejoonella antrihumi]|uniref:SseB family protein n=1 Tax=Leekyejoonella antrihumi TaxID=1660198 RepID=A0A563DRR4_9MICO|nr:SseB family protein [Leekyejoonella antrihumi]TWP32930.1 SseB family protein [Leekyejoonella antrihumi]